MSFRKSRAFSVLYMFVLGAIFAGLLSGLKVLTADKVADNEKIAASKNLVRVFELMEVTPKTSGEELATALSRYVRNFWVIEKEGTATIVETKPEQNVKVLYQMWAATDDGGQVTAFAFPIGGKGFWGPVLGIMSVEPDAETIRTVVWTRHGETPGLGARIEEKQYREKFRGKLATDPAQVRFAVVPDGQMGDDPHKIDQITGATQTTVVGMGAFLNDNFADWHKYFPMLQRHLITGNLLAETGK